MIRKVNQEEIDRVCTELKRLKINPDTCMDVIHQFFPNVDGVIARVKEASNNSWCSNPTGLFLASCKNGIKAENPVDNKVNDWYNWARSERIVIGMTDGSVVYTPDDKSFTVQEMMQMYPLPK